MYHQDEASNIVKMNNSKYDIVDLNEEIHTASLAENMNIELAKINDTFHAPLISKFPITELAGLGAAFATISSLIPQGVAAETVAENGGLFRCIFPDGVTGQLAQTGNQYIGGILKDSGGFAQARWMPVAEGAKDGGSAVAMFNPQVLMIAVAVIGVTVKINEIKKGQEKIIDILERDKKSQLIADYEILQDYLEDYRYYFDNETTVTVNLNQVKNIKRNALKDVKSYQEELEKLVGSKNSLLKTFSANTNIKEIFDRFVHYKLAINVFSIASYMDIMLAKNFQVEYLTKEIDALKEIVQGYDEIYEKCYVKLSELRQASLGAKAVQGLAWLSRGAGKVIGSVPLVEKGPVDEALIAGGEKLESIDEKQLNKMLTFFEEYKECGATQITEHVETLNLLANKKTELLSDGKVMYLFSEKTA